MRVGLGKYEGAAAPPEATASPAAGGVSSSLGAMRVYMRGVGGGVTEADVVNTFGPLGRVIRVEFVRTKGRAFAFMDFEPKSDKSLAKLFAMYNGCMWKGGRLRLEKAKEHYLNRLRREWAEDAEATKRPIVVGMSKGLISSDKSKSMAEEKTQVRIFFPKLRKVKTLPFKGTGKHKYSFQRIVAPPLPIHFCDCEEHFQSPENPNQDQVNYNKDQTVVVNEEELLIINSVMNKLFEKADTNVADGKGFLATERGILDDSNDGTHFSDGEAAQQSDADADNLITNIGLGDGEDVLNLMQLQGRDATSVHQGLKLSKHQSFHDKLIPEKQNIKKRQISGAGTVSEAPYSKRARQPSEKSNKGKFASMAAEKIRDRETEHQEQIDLPPIQSQGSNYPTEDLEIIRYKTAQNLTLGKSTRGTSWAQKSSWKDLVGDVGSKTFTISHVLPSVEPLSARSSKSNGADDVRTTADGTAKPLSNGNYLKPVAVRENTPVKKIAASGHEEKSSKEDGAYVVGEGGLDTAPRSSSNHGQKSHAAKISIGQVCTFMRSAESVKEWTKTKAALSGNLKKKKHENATSEGTGPRQ